MTLQSRASALSLVLTGLVALACTARDSEDAETALREQQAALTLAEANLAQWSSLVTLPIVPVSGANLPDGKVLLWSAENRFSFGANLGQTYSVLYDPAAGTFTERLVTETGHDMFCPGTANLPDGRIFVNGG
jgi:large repetitive protein